MTQLKGVMLDVREWSWGGGVAGRESERESVMADIRSDSGELNQYLKKNQPLTSSCATWRQTCDLFTRTLVNNPNNKTKTYCA